MEPIAHLASIISPDFHYNRALRHNQICLAHLALLTHAHLAHYAGHTPATATYPGTDTYGLCTLITAAPENLPPPRRTCT